MQESWNELPREYTVVRDRTISEAFSNLGDATIV